MSRSLPPWTTALAATAGITLWLALSWRGPVINDVAWQMWIAGRLREGAILYVDILEINPPLWFWIGAGVVRVSELTGVGPVPGLLLLFAAVAMASLAACLRLAGDRREQASWGTAIVLFLLASSPYALGQREQFALLATLPWIALAARRANGHRVSPWLALAVGGLAALGLLLKPYFLLVPLLLEGWLLLRDKRFRVRPEAVALGTAGLGYGAAILIITPAYLTTMVPLVRTAYDGYNSELIPLLLEPALLAPSILLTCLLVAGREKKSPAVVAALLAGAAFLGAGLWQAKGFAYHFLPALGCGLVALALSLPVLRQASAAAKAAVLVGLALIALTTVREPARADHAAAAATVSLPRGSTILMLSVSGSAAWPLVQERGYTWPSRHMTHWMLGGVWRAKANGRTSRELERLGRALVAEVAADIERSEPAMLLIDRRYDFIVAGGVESYFRLDPRFAAALKDYRRERGVGRLTVYRRTGS